MKPGGRERHLPHYHARPANQQCPQGVPFGAWAGVVGAGNKAHEIASEHVAGTVLPTMSNSRNPDPEVFAAATKSGAVDPARALAHRRHRLGRPRRQGSWNRVHRSRNRRLQPARASQTGALQVYRDVKEVLDQLHTSPLAVLLR